MHYAMKSSFYSLGTFVTGTEKGAFVKEKGIHTEFPLDLLRVAKGVDAEGLQIRLTKTEIFIQMKMQFNNIL
ncbi:unnamed protein product [Rhizophagus irregularis]|nr:unnamed protein product [Rhizophagus irregularis]